MSVIKFTQQDLDRIKPFDPGFKLCKVTSYREELSRAKDSVNHVFELDVNLENGETRQFTLYFSEKALSMIIPFLQAVYDTEVVAGKEYDLSKCVGCELYVEFTKEPWKNPKTPNAREIIVNRAVAFQPKSNPPF